MGAYSKEFLARLSEIEYRVYSKLEKKNEPFDVPMVDPTKDEFAFLKNAEREMLIEDGEYDAIRLILEEERVAQEEYERELAEEETTEKADSHEGAMA